MKHDMCETKVNSEVVALPLIFANHLTNSNTLDRTKMILLRMVSGR